MLSTIPNIRSLQILRTRQALFEGIDKLPDRIDNISDTALQAFREHYRDDSITKDAIFDYIYGVLHAPSYRETFANDLSKMIPRYPVCTGFSYLCGGRCCPRRSPSQLRDVRTIPSATRLCTQWRTHSRIISDSVRGRCSSRISKQKPRSSSMSISNSLVSRTLHIGMLSTAERL